MFHPYSFYLQKRKNQTRVCPPIFSLPLLLHLVIHTPDVPNCLLLCPISPFGMSHFAFWDILRRVYAPIFAPFYPLFALISSHFRGKNGRQTVCLSPQLSGNPIPSHQCVTCKPVSEFLYLPLGYFLKKTCIFVLRIP